MPKLVSRFMIRETDYGEILLKRTKIQMSQLLSTHHQRDKLVMQFTIRLWVLLQEFQGTDQSRMLLVFHRRRERLIQFLQRTMTHGYTSSPTRTC